MAASLSPTQQQEDFKEKFLTCSICTEPYDNDQHQAKCLSCLHTYCKSCLQKLAGKRPKINCPNCRSLVTLPGGRVDNLPNNFIIENLKPYQDVFNQADIANLTKQRQQCKKHPNQDLILFCKEPNCKIPVCARGVGDHRRHDLVDPSSASDEIKADMQRSTAKVGCKSQEIAKKRAATEAMQKALTDNFNQKENDMRKAKDKMIKLIKSQYTEAHSHLKSLYQTEMDRLSSSIESLNLLTTQMTSACEFANQACDTSNPMQLLTSQNQIMERLSELENKELPETTSQKADLTLTDQHHSAVAQMQSSVQHLFDNDWKKEAQNLRSKSYYKNCLSYCPYRVPK